MSQIEEEINKLNNLITKYTNEISDLEKNKNNLNTITTNNRITLLNKNIKYLKEQKHMLKRVNRRVNSANQLQNQLRNNTNEKKEKKEKKEKEKEKKEKENKNEVIKDRRVQSFPIEKEQLPENIKRPTTVEEEMGDEVPKYKQGNPVITPIITPVITPVKTGFTETIVKKKINVFTEQISQNTNICPLISNNIGKKINRNFFVPSQFPNLTKKKSLFKTIKGGFGKKSRKYLKLKKL